MKNSTALDASRWRKALALTTIETTVMNSAELAVWRRLLRGGWWSNDLVSQIDALPEIEAVDEMTFSVQELRPEVMAFALLMEERLRQKDADKGQGWKNKTDIDLTVNVCAAARSIEQALFPHKGAKSIKALVDMSNHCMLLADVLGALGTDEAGEGWAGLDLTSPTGRN